MPVQAWFADFLPASASVSPTERARGAIGAGVGIFLTGLVSSAIVGNGLTLPLLIAPMGASAVLLFAVPASPLAQPWSILGGNLIAAAVGVTAARYSSTVIIAAPLAVGMAVLLMATVRCIHPPSGAVALTAVLGGPAVTALGYRFILWPVLLNSIIILLVAIAFNNTTRRRYPHRQATIAPNRHGTADPSALDRAGFSKADLDAVLRRYDQVLEISPADMEALFQQAEMESYRRRFGSISCDAIMARDVVSVQWGTPLGEAWSLMRKHRLRAMPVVDRARHVLGMVSDVDFMEDAGFDTYTSLAARLHRFIAPPDSDYTDRPEAVGQIMKKDVPTVRSDSHIVELVPMLADSGLRQVAVVDSTNHLVGIIAQSDLIASLYRSRFAEAAAAS